MPASGPVVIDASVGLKWVLPEPGSEAAARLYGELVDGGAPGYVPDLFWLETANALWRLWRGGSPALSVEEVAELFGILRSAPVRTEPAAPLSTRALEIALAADITTYDAAYVALSELREARLWTADGALVGRLEGTEWGSRVEAVGW